jgi:hypothetical protein
MSQLDFRLVHYNLSGWAIQRKRVNQKTGEEYWADAKYPGNLKTTAKSALDEAIPKETYESVEKLIQAVEDAEENILQALKEGGFATK